MKRISLLIGVFAFLCATPSFGQECFGPYVGSYGSCSGNGCFMQYASQPESGNQVIWNHYNIECCSEIVTAWVNTGAGCGADLSAKEESGMELLLGQGIRIMSRDCLGRPVIYTSPAGMVAHNSPPPIDLSHHDKLVVGDLFNKERKQ